MINSYSLYIILAGFLFALLGIITYGFGRRLPLFLSRMFLFVSAGLIILSTFSLMSGLMYETEYINSPSCSTELNTTSLNVTSNITTYSYMNTCDDRPSFVLGEYIIIFMLWTSFILGIFVFIGLMYLVGKVLNQW